MVKVRKRSVHKSHIENNKLVAMCNKKDKLVLAYNWDKVTCSKCKKLKV